MTATQARTIQAMRCCGALLLCALAPACLEPSKDAAGAIAKPEAEQAANDPRPVVLGEAHFLQSQALGERRRLNVCLPPGYEERPDQTYMTIYLLDGAVHEDYHHVAGLIQFLTTYQLMPPAIVVGVANVDRYRDFTHPSTVAEDKQRLPTSGGSEKFRRFLASELIPYVARHFRTSGERMLIGQSLGGLLAAEVFVETPSLFDSVIMVSPSFWWSDGALLARMEPALQAAPERSGRLCVVLGSEGERMQQDVDRFVKALADHAPPSLRWHYLFLPEETHATILHRALYQAMETLYGETHPGM